MKTPVPCKSVASPGAGAPESLMQIPRHRLFQAVVMAVREQFPPSYDGQLSASQHQAESIAYRVLMEME